MLWASTNHLLATLATIAQLMFLSTAMSGFQARTSARDRCWRSVLSAHAGYANDDTFPLSLCREVDILVIMPRRALGNYAWSRAGCVKDDTFQQLALRREAFAATYCIPSQQLSARALARG